jgi:hypothetical protein
MRLGLMVFAVLLVGCAAETPSATVEPTTQRRPPATLTASPTAGYPAMFGTKYSVTVAQRIDALMVARDCDGLQREFDTADANDNATRTRTGSGTADLMGYIDDRLRSTGCYR